MNAGSPSDGDADAGPRAGAGSGGAVEAGAARARAWRDAVHAAICDVHEPWAHGTVVRATRYPEYYLYNVVRVEEDPGAMSVDDLIAVADRGLAGLAHRRIDVDVVEAGDARRADFEARGWEVLRLLLMHHESPPAPAPAPAIAVETVPYDAVEHLRVAWIHEQHPGDDDATSHLAQAREVGLRRGAQILAVREGGVPIAYAQLVRQGGSAEISEVFVLPDHRGRGFGTAVTRAAIEAAADAEHLWIEADDEDRPKELYARLGFRPVWTTMELTLRP